MKKIMIITGLFAAGLVVSCGKNPSPDEQVREWYDQPTKSASEDDEPAVHEYLHFSENELFFGKEGGEKTVTCPEKWVFDLQSEKSRELLEERIMGVLLFNEFDAAELKDIRQIEQATFTWTAGKLIVPPGCSTKEVVDERPNLSSFIEKVPSFDYINLYECTLQTYVRGKDEGFPVTDSRGLDKRFTTFVDMGWFTATCRVEDWFESYEGFAYRTKRFDNGIVAPYIGAIGKWWIPKDTDPGNYPVTIQVSPNTTGEPRQYILRTSAAKSPIIINQE